VTGNHYSENYDAFHLDDISLRLGDSFLLCTDGVADQLGYDRLRDTLLTAASPAAAVDRLLQATLTAGGADNATAIVLGVTLSAVP
jgi:serine/threonine protein phosphatase PrpC